MPARARVIPQLRLVDQDFEPETSEDSEEGSEPSLGASLLAEMHDSSRRALDESDLAEQHLTPAEAFDLIPPAKGEAGNPVIWTAMILAGLARFVIVSLGHVIALGGATRTRAGLLTLVILLALSASWAAGALT